MAFVAAALSAKTLRIGNTQVERCTLLLARVLKIHADAMRAGWYGKGEIKIRLVLRANDIAGEHDICRRALGPSLAREHQYKKTGRCYQSIDCRQGDSFAAAWSTCIAGAANGVAFPASVAGSPADAGWVEVKGAQSLV
jgi:hypothetical protein